MAKRLTDAERQKIIAEYIECRNYRKVARDNGISDNAVRKIVKSDPGSSQKFEHKKEQNTADVLEFMDSRKEKVCDIIDLALEFLTDEKKYNRASLQQIATMMGIVIDKFTVVSERKDADDAKKSHDQIMKAIRELGDDAD